MILNLTDLSEEPLQSQIIRQIRAKILSGELEIEIELPSIRSLARDSQISVITVQRAYEILERDGLIHSRRGKGFYVSELNEKEKKEMAKQKLIEKIQPVISFALDDGMDPHEILAEINLILKKYKK